MILKFNSIVKEEKGRCANDKRRIVNSVIVSYLDEEGNEYRKRFSSYKQPVVPVSGTSKELNLLKEQF